MTSSNTVTAVVLTKNEADNLARCLASLRWCAEIIVLDSGSSDATVDVAKELGARVLTHVQPSPFRISEQRNWVLDHGSIRTAWVLFLDADETVPSPLQLELCKICEVTEASYECYELTPRYFFWGKWLKRTQGFPNWHARLIRRGCARFAGGVWEHFADGSRVGFIHEPYDHYANSKGLSDWLVRHDRYSSWDAQKITDFLANGDPAALGTGRKARLRQWAAKFYPVRPFARFLHMYVFRLGFLEGLPALVFCSLYFFYEWLTVIKVLELRRKARGQPL